MGLSDIIEFLQLRPFQEAIFFSGIMLISYICMLLVATPFSKEERTNLKAIILYLTASPFRYPIKFLVRLGLAIVITSPGSSLFMYFNGYLGVFTLSIALFIVKEILKDIFRQ